MGKSAQFRRCWAAKSRPRPCECASNSARRTPGSRPTAKGGVSRGGDFKSIVKLIQDQGWTRTWDDQTKNPWITAPGGAGVIGYDDAESISLKTAWAMQQGFKGVFFWQIGGDLLPDGTNPLQEAARLKLDLAQPRKTDVK